MDALVADLIKESSSTTGTVLNISLEAITGFARYSDAFSVDDVVEYAIRDGNNFEQGVGTVKASNTLDRTTPVVTYESGVYDNSSPSRITLSGNAVVACVVSKRFLDGLDKSFRPLISEATTARTLSLTDAAAYILCSNAAGCSVTVPPQSSVAWPDNCEIWGRGSVGAVTLVAGSGVTINIPASLSLVVTAKTQWKLKREAEDVWALSQSAESSGGGGGGGALEVSPEIVTTSKTLTSANGHYQLVEAATTALIKITMPDATTLDESGLSYLFTNHSKIPLQVLNNSGGKLFFVPPQSSAIIALEDNSTSDGKWSEITDNTTAFEVLGSASAATSASDAYASCAIDEEYALTVYTIGGAHLYGFISRANTSNAISAGTGVVINAAASYKPVVISPSPGYGMVVYQGTSNYLYARVFTISGTSISYVAAEQTLISTSVSSMHFSIYKISATEVALLYQDPASTSDLKVAVLSIATFTVTMNTAATIETGSNLYHAATLLTPSKLLVAYTLGADQYICVVNFSGTTSSPESAVDISEYSAGDGFILARDGVVKLTESKAIMVGHSGNYLAVRILYIDGNDVKGGITKQVHELANFLGSTTISACRIDDSKFALQGIRTGGGLVLGTMTVLGDAVSKYEPALIATGLSSSAVTDITYLEPYNNKTDPHNRLLSMRSEGGEVLVEGYLLHKQSVKF